MTQESINKFEEAQNNYHKIVEELGIAKEKLLNTEKEIIAKEAVCQEGDTIVMSNTEYKVRYIIIDEKTNTFKYYFERLRDGTNIVFTENQLAFVKIVK